MGAESITIDKIKKDIVNYINKTYDENMNKKMYENNFEILKWKNNILNKIFDGLDELNLANGNNFNSNTNNSYNLIKYKIQKKDRINYLPPKKEYQIENTQKFNYLAFKDFIKIDNIQNLDFFTSKDIQDENKEITIIFQKEAYNYMNSEEEIENQNVAYFLKNVAEISRKSYSEAKILFKNLLEKFNKTANKKNILLDKEQDKKEFSSWVKKYEKDNNLQEDKNSMNQSKIKENQQQKFLCDLNSKLKIMYLHCELAFPLVEISFEKEEKFNSEKMIDFINRGKRKVNFVILPSLFSNGNFLQNGKSWVFTYNKDTFKFEESELDILNKNYQ